MSPSNILYDTITLTKSSLYINHYSLDSQESQQCNGYHYAGSMGDKESYNYMVAVLVALSDYIYKHR